MLLDQLKGKLIVSCQALPDEPLHSSYIMLRMAVAAKHGGAPDIHTQSVEDINAIMELCDLPMTGIIKCNYPDSDTYITATKKESKSCWVLSARSSVCIRGIVVAFRAEMRLHWLP